MKKVITLALAVVLALSLGIASFAEAKIPESDLTVKATTKAPTIDGVYNKDEGWGDPLFKVKGSDVFDYVTSGDSTKFRPWAQTNIPLWQKEDGSVEALKAVTFTGYARWDADNLYMCYIVDGLEKFYPNPSGDWKGNSIQLTFGPDNEQQNSDPKAMDEDGDGTYTEGFVGNEYLLAMISGGPKAYLQLGKYGGGTSSTLRGLDFKATDTGNKQQIYEVAFGWDKIDVSAAKDKAIPFCVALNINISENLGEGSDSEYSQPYYNGFQIGKGIFQQRKSDIFDSLHLVLSGDATSNGGGDNDATSATDSEGETKATTSNGNGSGSGSKDNTSSSDASTSAMFLVAAVAALGSLVILKKR